MAVRSLVAPWPGKSGRVLTCLGEPASAEYAVAVAGVAEHVEAGLDRCVHGGRVRSFDPLSIEPWREARAQHRRVAMDLATDATTAMRLDVEDCFRSIGADQVREALERVSVPRGATTRVCAFLERTRRAGIPGLPVGPEPSAVLANAVLRPLDVAAQDSGVRHVRWYDDLLILASSTRQALEVEDAVADACRGLGLRLHPGKRRVAVGPAAIRRLILAEGVASGPSS